MSRISKVYAVALVCIWLVSCGSGGNVLGEDYSDVDYSDKEMVLSLSIDPPNPAPGDVVKVSIDSCVTHIYPCAYGCGPTYSFQASDGTLIYFMEGITPEPVYGTEVQSKSRVVEWQLPDEPGKYWVEASLKDGGKKLMVYVK